MGVVFADWFHTCARIGALGMDCDVQTNSSGVRWTIDVHASAAMAEVHMHVFACVFVLCARECSVTKHVGTPSPRVLTLFHWCKCLVYAGLWGRCRHGTTRVHSDETPAAYDSGLKRIM